MCCKNLPWELSRGTKVANKRLVKGIGSYLVHAKPQCEAQARTHPLWTQWLEWLCAGGWSQRPASSLGSEGFSHCLPGSAPARGRQTDRLTPPPRTGTKSIQHFTLKSLVAVSRWFLTNRTILLSSMTNNTPSGWGRKVLDYDPALFLKGLKLWAGFVVTHKPDSPGKENSNGNILWAISFMYHFLYALLFVLSEETQPHYFRGCYCSICISPRLNHNTQSRNIPSLTYLHYLIIIHHSIKRFNPHRINISI